MDMVKVGHWAFFLGVLLAVVAGFGGEVPAFTTTLFVLGLIVGFLNVTEKESTAFLVGVITLLVASTAVSQLGTLNVTLSAIVNYLVSFVASAGVIVALKQVVGIAQGDK